VAPFSLREAFRFDRVEIRFFLVLPLPRKSGIFPASAFPHTEEAS
jgi:hypothetical protein